MASIIEGITALPDAALLEIVAGESAVKALEQAKSLRVLAGWTEVEAGLKVAACFELGRRANAIRLPKGAPLVSSLDVYRQFRSFTRDLKHERFYSVLLDVKNRILRETIVAEGSLSASLVHPREAFVDAVREPAHAVIFVHNHPSGDPMPSEEDAVLTLRLTAAGEVLGIRVLDHVIIGDDDYFSFADAGRMK